MTKGSRTRHDPPAVLGYICILCLLVTILIPFFVQYLSNPHNFWRIWEYVGVFVTSGISIVFWVYELIDKRLTLGKALDRITSALGVLGALSFIAGELVSIYLDSYTGKLFLLSLGAAFFATNTLLIWRNCKRQSKAKEIVLRYRSVFRFSDFPTFVTFLILLVFTSILKVSDPALEHQHEILAFVSGAVAFQVASSNIAYVLEFFPRSDFRKLLDIDETPGTS